MNARRMIAGLLTAPFRAVFVLMVWTAMYVEFSVNAVLGMGVGALIYGYPSIIVALPFVLALAVLRVKRWIWYLLAGAAVGYLYSLIFALLMGPRASLAESARSVVPFAICGVASGTIFRMIYRPESNPRSGR